MEYFGIKNGINLSLVSFPRLLVLHLAPQKTQAAFVCVLAGVGGWGIVQTGQKARL